jgi:hypothetical protein
VKKDETIMRLAASWQSMAPIWQRLDSQLAAKRADRICSLLMAPPGRKADSEDLRMYYKNKSINQSVFTSVII